MTFNRTLVFIHHTDRKIYLGVIEPFLPREIRQEIEHYVNEHDFEVVKDDLDHSISQLFYSHRSDFVILRIVHQSGPSKFFREKAIHGLFTALGGKV